MSRSMNITLTLVCRAAWTAAQSTHSPGSCLRLRLACPQHGPSGGPVQAVSPWAREPFHPSCNLGLRPWTAPGPRRALCLVFIMLCFSFHFRSLSFPPTSCLWLIFRAAIKSSVQNVLLHGLQQYLWACNPWERWLGSPMNNVLGFPLHIGNGGGEVRAAEIENGVMWPLGTAVAPA